MRSLSSLVQVRRNGEVLGNYAPEDLAPFLEKGRLLPDDLCSSKAHPDFIPLSVYLEKVPLEAVAPSSPVITRAHPSNRGRHSSRKHKHKTGLLLAGWISFLIAIAALVGAGFWIAGLQKELDKTKANLRAVEDAKREYQRSFLVSKETSENGLVRGTIILRNSSGERVVIAGKEIRLYPRGTIENYLESKMQNLTKYPAGEEANVIASDLPEPAAKTTTDNSGRFEIEVPEEGRYVIYTSMDSTTTGNPNKLWFIAFDSRDILNTPVDITDANSVKQYAPNLMIIEGR